MDDGILFKRDLGGGWYIHVTPLTYGRARLHIGYEPDGPVYRDGW